MALRRDNSYTASMLQPGAHLSSSGLEAALPRYRNVRNERKND